MFFLLNIAARVVRSMKFVLHWNMQWSKLIESLPMETLVFVQTGMANYSTRMQFSFLSVTLIVCYFRILADYCSPIPSHGFSSRVTAFGSHVKVSSGVEYNKSAVWLTSDAAAWITRRCQCPFLEGVIGQLAVTQLAIQGERLWVIIAHLVCSLYSIIENRIGHNGHQ